MKEPWLWDELDIQDLINNAVQESLTLDYKRCDSLQKTDGKKREISKDVSAFANSAGGVIIYGMEEDKHIPTAIDTGFDPHVISKEWLEQVINSTIQRRIDGIRIKEVALSGSNVGKAIFVVSIPQSQNAPHMAFDHRYYKRFNFESVMMEDYEVRDVSHRLSSPDLFIRFQQSAHSKPDLRTDGHHVFKVQVMVGNRSSIPAEFAILRHSIDLRIRPSPGQQADNAIQIPAGRIEVYSSTVDWRGSLRLPILQSSLYTVSYFPISIPPGRTFYLFWETHSPMMNRKAGVAKLRVDGNQLVIEEESIDWIFEREVVHIVS